MALIIGEGIRLELREKGVEFIVSISGTQMYRKKLREQTKYGIVNCHGALLPKYRGLMPSFWTLANGEPPESILPFALERFATGALVDEGAASGVAH